MNICQICGLKSDDIKTLDLPAGPAVTHIVICKDRPACRLRELAKIKREAEERVESYTLPDLPV